LRRWCRAACRACSRAISAPGVSARPGAVFAGAHGLALLFGTALILAFAVFGRQMVGLAAGGSDELTQMGLTYLRITTTFAPLLFVLSVNSDALRNEGRVGFMASMSLLVSLANIAFNYLLIAVLDLGVAGSAYGTAMAQALAFAIILTFRFRGATALRPSALVRHGVTHSWTRILALGAPQSLSFVGLALGSASIMAALQMVDSPKYADTVSAYGVITRVMTFAFLPLLGLSHAMQTITGNNYGARAWHRSNASLTIAMATAFAYCAVLQGLMTISAANIGRAFVDDPAVVAEVARILPVVIALFFLSGPLMMIASYFQSIGDASRAALLGLAKPYLFAIPLTFALAGWFGEPGVWRAGPLAEALLLALTLVVLAANARHGTRRLGLYQTMAFLADAFPASNPPPPSP
jgi:Na+-driven multidrug efflux pump